MSDYLGRALELAHGRRGFCAPNPAVGAVIVQDGTIVGEGAHWVCGAAHAEVVAIQQAGVAASGADIYITLVPCHHFGQTPPCTDAIIAAGIARVFYAYDDPSADVDTASSVAKLAAAGVPCIQISNAAVDQFYTSYAYWARQAVPYVTAKLALSLDGKIASAGNQTELITGLALQQHTHQQRLASDAILTTAATVLADDPQLNCRLDMQPIAKPIYVLDRLLGMPENAKLWHTAKYLVIFYDQNINDHGRIEKYKQNDAVCVPISCAAGNLSWQEIMSFIGRQGVHDLWVEAGGKCLSSLLAGGWLGRAWLYYGMRVLGENAISGLCVANEARWQTAQRRWLDISGEGVCELVWRPKCLPA